MRLRTYLLVLIVFLKLSPAAFAQPSLTRFLTDIAAFTDSLTRQAKVDSFIIAVQQNGGAPVIDGNKAGFIYKGGTTPTLLAGDFNGWTAAPSLTRLPQSNLWYYHRTFEMNARLDYKFVQGSNYFLDPLNPHQIAGGFGPNSELAMPAYRQPESIVYRPQIRHGALQNLSISSTYMSRSYQVKIYLPPGYSSSQSTRYRTAYFQDGSEYLTLGSAANVLDNLLDSGKIAPIIGVFITPTNRNEEYAGSLRDLYRKFFVYELVPKIDSLFKTIQYAPERLIIGTSFGANISALISYNHPDVFGVCALHSAAFWPNNYEALNLIGGGVKKEIAFSAVWGTYEEVYQYMRPFRDSLLAKGYQFPWLELPEGHSWGLWRATLGKLLIDLNPPIVGIELNLPAITPNDFTLLENYPNPFNPVTTVVFRPEKPGQVKLTVYNSIGAKIAVLFEGLAERQTYKIAFDASGLPSGSYYIALQQANGIRKTLPIALVK